MVGVPEREQRVAARTALRGSDRSGDVTAEVEVAGHHGDRGRLPRPLEAHDDDRGQGGAQHNDRCSQPGRRSFPRQPHPPDPSPVFVQETTRHNRDRSGPNRVAGCEGQLDSDQCAVCAAAGVLDPRSVLRLSGEPASVGECGRADRARMKPAMAVPKKSPRSRRDRGPLEARPGWADGTDLAGRRSSMTEDDGVVWCSRRRRLDRAVGISEDWLHGEDRRGLDGEDVAAGIPARWHRLGDERQGRASHGAPRRHVQRTHRL